MIDKPRPAADLWRLCAQLGSNHLLDGYPGRFNATVGIK